MAPHSHLSIPLPALRVIDNPIPNYVYVRVLPKQILRQSGWAWFGRSLWLFPSHIKVKLTVKAQWLKGPGENTACIYMFYASQTQDRKWKVGENIIMHEKLKERESLVWNHTHLWLYWPWLVKNSIEKGHGWVWFSIRLL